jgi:aconitase B
VHLPDTCDTGAVKHTRFLIGVKFPADSGAVATSASRS